MTLYKLAISKERGREERLRSQSESSVQTNCGPIEHFIVYNTSHKVNKFLWTTKTIGEGGTLYKVIDGAFRCLRYSRWRRSIEDTCRLEGRHRSSIYKWTNLPPASNRNVTPLNILLCKQVTTASANSRG